MPKVATVAKTIRRSLFAALAGFAVLLCLCYTGLALVIAYVTEDMLVQRLLGREAVAVSARWQQDGKLTPSGNDLIKTYASYADLPQVVREQLPPAAPRAEVFTGTGQHYHALALELVTGGKPVRAYLLADVAPVLVVQRLAQEVGGVVAGVALALVALALLPRTGWHGAWCGRCSGWQRKPGCWRLAPRCASASGSVLTRSVSWRAAWKPRSWNCRQPCSANTRSPATSAMNCARR